MNKTDKYIFSTIFLLITCLLLFLYTKDILLVTVIFLALIPIWYVAVEINELNSILKRWLGF